MRLVLAGALAVAVAAGAAPATAMRPSTTTPGVVYPVKVTLTTKAIVVARDKLMRKDGLPRYPRGAVIRYELVNKGTKPVIFEIWGSKTDVIKPGRKDSILVNWNYRGRFPYRQLFHGKAVGKGGFVTVF